jgi:hypothetical protein
MKKTVKELRSEGFICTDGSKGVEQWVKKLSPTRFLVYEKDADVMSDIDLNDYTEAELEEYISAYYASLKELRSTYTGERGTIDDANMVIAECISETDLAFN